MVTSSDTQPRRSLLRESNERSNTDSKVRRIGSKIRYLRAFIILCRQLNQIFEEDETTEILRNFFRRYFTLDGFALLLRLADSEDMQKCAAFGTLVESHVLPSAGLPFSNSIRFDHNGLKPAMPEVWTQVNAHGSLLQFVMRNEQGQTIGRLCFHRSQPGNFKRREILFFKAISQFLSHHLQKIRLLRQARELAFTDSLTTILNRRYFDQRFSSEFNRAVRYQRVLSLLMIDIDHFKKYNDTHGHPMGDLVLKQTAAVLERNLRQSDILCRYGGDEFVVLLPEIDLANAKVVAEKLRRIVYYMPFEGEDVLPTRHLTLSIGIACYPQTAMDAEELLRGADKALYQAKQKGRNCVVAAKLKPKNAMSTTRRKR